MHSLLLLVCIGSNTFSAISGLSLASKNSIITTTDFSLVCTIQGSLTTTISIKNPSGSLVGSCVPPPVGCGSGLGNTVVSSTADGITKVTIDMDRSNINIPSSEGSWSCSNGTNEVFFQVKLFSITKPKVWTDSATALTGSEVNVEIDCIYPYPSLIRIDYIQESTRAVLKSTTGLTFTNGTASNCNVIDTRAISMKGTFKLTDDKLNGAKVLIAAVVLVNGDVLDTGYSNFTYQPKGLTTPLSTISSDLSATVSEPQSTISSDMPTTVSEVPPPPVTTSSAGLSQEMIIIISSSILAAGVLIFLIVLIVKLCRKKNKKTLAKNKENLFAIKQGNFTKKDALKSFIEPRNAKLSGKRVTKQESILLDKFEHTQFNNSEAPKGRMYEHYPKTTDYMYRNNSGNQHVLNHSHAEKSIILFGNQYDRYPKSDSGPNNRMLYQSRYPEHPRQNEGMFQYYNADNLYRGQQMYHRPYVAQYDHHIKNKPENKRFEKRTYERNWDFLY